MKALLTLAAFLVLAGTAHSRVMVSYDTPNTVDWANIYFNNGYTLNYDQAWANRCASMITSTAVPANHALFNTVNNAYTVETLQDPLGRGYYVYRKMQCGVNFINPSTDCSNRTYIYASGENRTETIRDTVDCLTIRTQYTCTMAVWGPGTVLSQTPITGCRPK